LNFAFATKALRELCEDSEALNRAFGDDNAKLLMRRLADLRAAPSVSDILVGVLQEISCDGKPHIAIKLKPDFLITFCSNHKKNSKLPSGGVDWSKVSRIKITQISTANV